LAHLRRNNFIKTLEAKTCPSKCSFKITFQNDDTVSHSIVSAKRDTNARGIGHDFRMFADGRVATGEIPPGESRSVLITDKGFLFLVDLDYAWVRMDVVSFPEVSQSQIIRSVNDARQKGN